MRNSMGVKISAMLLSAVLLLSGCSWMKGGDEEAKAAVKTAMDNLNKLKTANYELTVDGKVMMSKKAVGEGEDPGEANISLSFSGGTDNDPKVPRFSMAGGGKIEGMGENVSFDFDVRYLNDKINFSLGSLEGINDPMAAGVLSSVLGKWWYLPLPANDINQYSFQHVADADLTPEQKKAKELWENTNFVEEAENIGEADFDGTSVIKYEVDLDEKAMQKYIEEVGKMSGEELAESQSTDMQKFFELVSFEGEVWVGKDDQTIRKMAGKLSIDDDGSGVTGEFDVAMSFDNFDGEVKIDEPAGAQLFDLLSLLGGAPAEAEGLTDEVVDGSASIGIPGGEPGLIKLEETTSSAE